MTHAVAGQSVFSQVDIVASSETVPINDMMTGWGSDYQRGELAFMDATWSTGISFDNDENAKYIGQFHIQREQRTYYYLNFDKETADFYRSLEQNKSLTSDKTLDLTVQQFDALGLAFGLTTQEFHELGIDFKVGAHVSLYQLGHFQFGSVNGIAEAGDTSVASAIIDYQYDNDKILDHQADVDNGLGVSFSTDIVLTNQQWQVELQLKDLVNSFQWENAAYTKGCVNVGGGSQAQCQTQGSASGVSGHKKLTKTIPITTNARVTHLDTGISVYGMHHDAYNRLGIEKAEQTSLGRLALFLYYPRLLGASWKTDLFNIQLGSDTLKLSKARNVQLNMGINWHW